jgi:hypothetical protein
MASRRALIAGTASVFAELSLAGDALEVTAGGLVSSNSSNLLLSAGGSYVEVDATKTFDVAAIDRKSAAGIAIGGTNANAVSLGRTGVTTTIAGLLATSGGQMTFQVPTSDATAFRITDLASNLFNIDTNASPYVTSIGNTNIALGADSADEIALTGAVSTDIRFKAGATTSLLSPWASIAGVNGGMLHAFGGTGGDETLGAAGLGGEILVQGGWGGESVNAKGGAGAVTSVKGGSGGDATGSGDGGDGGALALVGGLGTTPSGTGGPGDGGAVSLTGGAGDVGGNVTVRGGLGTTTNGSLALGDANTSSITLGASGIATTINGELYIDDGGSGTDAFLDMTDGDSAGVSVASHGRIRYNVTLNRFEYSENGGAYAAAFGGGGGGWSDDGTVVRLTTATDNVAIGVATMLASEKLRVVGDTSLQGNVTFESGAAYSITQASAVAVNNLTVKAQSSTEGNGARLILNGGDAGSSLAADYNGGMVHVITGAGVNNGDPGEFRIAIGAYGVYRHTFGGSYYYLSGWVGETQTIGVTARAANQVAADLEVVATENTYTSTGAQAGHLFLLGGSCTGGGGAATAGNVNVDAGTGDTNGAVNIGRTNASAIAVGATGIPTTVDGELYIDDGGSGTAAFFDMTDGDSAGVSVASHGRIRYNVTLNRFEYSENGGAYAAAFGGGGGGWQDDGTVVRLVTTSDTVAIGATTMSSTEKLRVVGDVLFEGDLLFSNDVTHWVRPSQSSGSGAVGQRLHLYAGQGADDATTPGNGGVLRGQGGQGGTAVDVAGGAGGGTTIAAGSGGDATGTGDGGAGGKLLLAGGIGTTPSGTGGKGDGGDAEIRGGDGDTGGDTYVRGGVGTTAHGGVLIGDSNTSSIAVGATGLATTINGELYIDDGGSGTAAFFDMTDGDSAAVSAASHGRLRYNVTLNRFEYSQNGGAWSQAFGSASAGGWNDDGTVVRLTTSTDDVAIGTATMSGTEKLRVVGGVRFELPDNDGSALIILGGGNAYIDIDTTTGSEVMEFGNATDDPEFRFAGAGNIILTDGEAAHLLQCSAASAGNDAGNFSIFAADGGDESATVVGDGGAAYLVSGSGGDATTGGVTPGAAGVVYLVGGDGGSSSSGVDSGTDGGGVVITGGSGGTATGGGTGGGGSGGSVILAGGPGASGDAAGGVGGNASIQGGLGALADDGIVNVGTSQTSAVNIGAASVPISLSGTILTDITFSETNLTPQILVEQNSTAGANGLLLALSAGQGGDGVVIVSPGGIGGHASLNGGQGGPGTASSNGGGGGSAQLIGGAGGTDNGGGGGAGGGAFVRGGAGTGSEDNGPVFIGDSSTDGIYLGDSSQSFQAIQIRGPGSRIRFVTTGGGDHAISIDRSTTAGATGDNQGIFAGGGGNGSGATPGGSGGTISVSGGSGGAGTATAVAGPGNVGRLTGGFGGTNGGAGGGVGGNAEVSGGQGTGAEVDGKVLIASSTTSAIEVGNATDNPPYQFKSAGKFEVGDGTTSQPLVEFSVADNSTSALRIYEGSTLRSYINVYTFNGVEKVQLGNTTNNPGVEQLGTGQVTFGGNVNANNGIDIDGALTLVEATGNTAYIDMTDGGSSGVAIAGHGRFRYNETTNRFEVSENGGAYVALVGISGTGTDNRLMRWSTGNAAQDSGVTLDDNDNMSGVASVSVVEATGNAAYIDLTDGENAATAAANHGRLRYNETTDLIEKSENTGAYVPVNAPKATIVNDPNTATTTSAADTQMANMTNTPAAGTYMVIFSGSLEHISNNATINPSIYAGGTKVAASERQWMRGAAQGGVATPFHCMAIVTVNGAQAIQGMWRTSVATATVYEHQLMYMRVI